VQARHVAFFTFQSLRRLTHLIASEIS